MVGDYRFERSYAATVELANGDGTVDLRPDDEAVRGLGLQRVPIRVGVPSAAVRAEPGARCLFAFADGDPRKPHVCAWEYARASAVVSFDGGAAAVARHGDLVDVLLSASTPIAGVMTGAVTVPGSPPTIVPVPPGSQFSGLAVVAVPVQGSIVGGAQRIKA